MSTYQHLMLATDFSESAARAAKLTACLARAFGARSTATHVFDATPFRFGFGGSREELIEQLAAAATKELERVVKDHLAGLPNVEAAAIDAESAPMAIADQARARGVDLCVVGTQGRTGLARLLIGSVAENVVRHAPCDVLSVPPKSVVDHVPRRILAPTDFSEAAGIAVDAADRLAKSFEAELTLVHCFDPSLPVPNTSDAPGPFMPVMKLREELQKALDEARKSRFGDDARVSTALVAADSTAEGINAYAADNKSELIVIGSHGKSAFARFLIGSVTERVVRGAPCPVLTVRAKPIAR